MVKPEPSVTLIGGGRMGSALAGGWLASGKVANLNIIDPAPSDTLKAWDAEGRIALNPPVDGAGILVIAVKPQVFAKVAPDLAAYVKPRTEILSIMAGITLDQLASAFGTDRIARAMPNTPGLIGKGVAILSVADGASKAMVTRMQALLDPLGVVEGPIPEAKLSAATAVSGCGPAYVFLLAEAMASAGAASGLDRDFALRLAKATIEGAGALMAGSEDTPSKLRQNVTSPGGVTQAALDVLMDDKGMPSLMRDAIRAAVARDRALSQESK